MQSFGWKKDGSVQAWLFAEGYRFDFFQAIRLLEKIGSDAIHREAAQEKTQIQKIPTAEVAGIDSIQLRARVGFTFPPSEIHEITQISDAPFRAEITANILSLAGTQGPLPDVFTELVLERTKYRDTALVDFLDIFHHRLLLLMYRVRQRHRLWLEWEKPECGRQSKYIYAFSGLGIPELKNRMQVQDRVVLSYAGLLWQKPRSAIGLESILSDCFGVKTKIKPMLGSWMQIEPDDRTRIGERGYSQILGISSVIGTRVWNRQGRFDIYFDPLNLQEFYGFLPGQKKHGTLHDLVRYYTNDQFEFCIHLTLRPEEVPLTRLGKSQLGWTSWIQGINPRRAKSIMVKGNKIDPRSP